MVSESVTVKINIIPKNCLHYLSSPSAETHTHKVVLFIVTVLIGDWGEKSQMGCF